jgi:hypothetical protein
MQGDAGHPGLNGGVSKKNNRKNRVLRRRRRSIRGR